MTNNPGTITVCDECGCECNLIDVDYGIGYYEYGSATGVHVDIDTVSACCEATFDNVLEAYNS